MLDGVTMTCAGKRWLPRLNRLASGVIENEKAECELADRILCPSEWGRIRDTVACVVYSLKPRVEVGG